jgi:hypothetical protein
VTTRAKGYLLLLGTLGGGLLFGWGSVAGSHRDGWLAAAIVACVVGGIVSLRLRCPNCRWHVFAHRVGDGMAMWGPWIGKRCEQCGHPLGRVDGAVGER